MQPDLDWPDELVDWVYGPLRGPDDEPLSVEAQYEIAEEELRIRWIPGYKKAVLRYIRLLQDRDKGWKADEHYPTPTTEELLLADRISKLRQRRVDPYNHATDTEGRPW